jgi:spermidine synthase
VPLEREQESKKVVFSRPGLDSPGLSSALSRSLELRTTVCRNFKVNTKRYFAVVLLLFVGSGCAALVYEIVWFQLLSLVIGSSAVSLAVLLGTYMGGMCAGSLGLALVVPARLHPLRAYALIELGIAALALLILVALPYAGGLYVAVGGSGAGGLVARGVLCALFLLPPTVLMGATLPAVARWVQASPGHASLSVSSPVSWIAAFYGANTAGAVLGCLFAGYYLLRVHDVTVATWAGVAINVAVAVVAWGLSALSTRANHEAPIEGESPADLPAPAGSWPVYGAIALSGMTALAAEVVWTRLLSLLLGATVYTFSLILAVFLIGLGIGSAAGSVATRALRKPRVAFGVCQCLLVGSILWAAHALTRSLPYWPVSPGLARSPIYQFQIDFARCLWAILPSACFWGASFPLALASVVPPQSAAGALTAGRAGLDRLVGRVYAANTVGGIVGAIAASLVFIPSFGTQQSQRILIAATALGAALLLVPVPAPGSGELVYAWRRIVPGVLGLAMLRWVTSAVPAVPAALVAWGHNVASHQGYIGEVVYVGEGMNSSMAVTRTGRVLNYHNAGKIQASSEPADMRLQRMLGHLVTLVPEHPSNVLVIGCGAGVTAGAVSIDPAVERETIAEIESLVPRRVARLFGAQNFDVVDNPKVHVEIDDARHFLLTSTQKFDGVTSDPFDPWVKGAASLYTAEFFDLVKRHLNPGAAVTVFVQLYESGEDAVKSEVATFFEAFPDAMVFGNTINGYGYDVVLLGRVERTPIDIDHIEQRLSLPEYDRVKDSLREIGFASMTQLFSTYAGGGSQMQPWLEGAQINRDRNLRLQYLAGLGMNVHDETAIYRHMTASRQYPGDMFLGTPQRLATLRAAMGTGSH